MRDLYTYYIVLYLMDLFAVCKGYLYTFLFDKPVNECIRETNTA